jgi:tetratricopeptide (TPR) repeat protein
MDARKALADGSLIPENIADAIQTQLDHLDEDTKLTVRIAAVMGAQFEFGILRAAHPSPIAEHELTKRLASLEESHVVCPTLSSRGGAYRFHHPMTPKVIYASLLSADRERLHRWVGRAVEDVCFDDLDSRCELVAHHYSRGNVPCRAVPYLLAATNRGVQTRTYREVLALYRRVDRVLSLCTQKRSPRCVTGVQLFLELQKGDLCYRMAEIGAAEQAYGRAQQLASDLADPGHQASAQLRLARTALRQARYQDALVLTRQAIQRLAILEDDAASAQGWLLTSQAHGLQGRFQESDRYLGRAIGIYTRLQHDAGLARCKSWQGEMWRLSGQLSRASSVLDRAADLGRRAADSGVVAESMSRHALVFLSLGQWGRALDLSRMGWTTERARGSRLSMLDAQQVLARTLIQVGAHAEAWEHLQEVLAASADTGCLLTVSAASWLAGEALLALGESGHARDRFRQALELGRKANSVEPTVRALLGLSKLAGREGDWSEGQRLCTEVRAKARQVKMELVVVEARLGLARAYAGRHDWTRAQREAAQALDASYRLHSPYQSLSAAAILGEAMARLEQYRRAEHYAGMMRSLTQRLAETLSESDAGVFLNSSLSRGMGESTAECPVSVI